MVSTPIDGTEVKHLRLAHGWSRAQFSRMSGVSVSYLKYIEGEHPQHGQRVSQRIKRDIAKTLRCKVTDITPRDEPVEAAA